MIERILGLLSRRSEFITFASASALQTVASTITTLVTLRWLLPRELETWQVLVSYQIWCEFLKLGVPNGVTRQATFQLGRGDSGAAAAILKTGSAASLITCLLGCVVFIFAATSPTRGAEHWLLAVAAATASWISTSYGNYLQATYRSTADFNKLSRILLIDALVSIVLVTMVWRWGFQGFCVRTIVQSAFLTALLHQARPSKLAPKIEYQSLLSILSVGLPLFGAAYLLQVAGNAERTLLGKFAAEGSLGLYAPALYMQAALTTLSGTLQTYAYPKLSHHFGRTGDSRALWTKGLWASAAGGLTAAPLALFGWFTLPQVVPLIFPEYTESTPSLRLSLLTGTLLALRPISSVFPATKAWIPHYTWILSFALIRWIAGSIMIQGSDPLTGAALSGLLAAGVSTLVMFTGAWFVTCRNKGT